MLGDLDGSPCFASESCAFDLLGARLVRELRARRGGGGARRRDRELPPAADAATPARCIFEHVYFARPDSKVFGDSVSRSRACAMGARLAREAPAAADIVVPVPDSGLFAALGYSRESGLPFEFGLIRNHYVGRTFIEPKQSIRHFGVKIKLNPVRELIEGKRVVLVDDSIVRGTTSRKIVAHDARGRRRRGAPAHLRAAHALALPLRHRHADARGADRRAAHASRRSAASSRPTASPTSRSRACSPPSAARRDSYCTACWTGDYRVADRREDRRQAELFPIRAMEE